ncbi:MAG TPA: STAS domain-containing protein [Micromonosporaceae bacterium]|nr:STAS domain-containing protein [Micromonosporaceae bacterium]
MTIDVDEQDVLTVLVVRGELDLLTASDLAAVAEERIAAGDRSLVLDLSALTFCDSTGLATFVWIRNLLQDEGGRLALATPTPMVRRVLDVTGLCDVFGAYSTVEEAASAFAG